MGMKRPRRVMLSEDILEHSVLPCLPAKYLIRFKCVSRRWCDLISNKFFILQQYRRCTVPHSLICLGLNLSASFYTVLRSAGIPDFHLHFKGWEINLVVVCNGLLVLHCWTLERTELFVGNPVLQDWKMLPMPEDNYILWIGLAFDPVDSAGCYELVCPCEINGVSPRSDVFGFMVLSSKTGKWKESKSIINLTAKSFWFSGGAVFLSGKLYWPMGVDVLWFDTKRDCSGIIPSPIRACDVHFCYLDLSEHGLTFIRYYDYEIHIWAMKDQQWLKLYHVQIEDIVHGNPDIFASLCHGMDVRNRKPFDIIAGKHYACFINFGGKVIFFMIGEVGFGYDVESGETSRFAGYVSPGRWSPFKSNLIPLPGQSQ